MPICPRVLIEGAVYHVVVRGNQRQNVFKHEVDYQKYLKFIKKYKNRHKARIYAYCLMTNHIHLLIDPEDSDSLKKIMHGISLSYSKYFNYKYKKCGHLWQGRYKNYVIQKDYYLVNTMTYIEMNPVRAKICQRPEDYRWSSYAARTLGKPDELLDDYVL
jgi:putative transposase